jgi:N,N'-diacetyllegionaminate synthase
MLIGNQNTRETVYVVAEIGGNHNGEPEIAYRLVEEAAKAGASAVKFQTYKAETLVHPSVEPVPIVKKFYDTQLARFKGLELEWEVYERIFEQCRELGIHFLTTPFDLEILERMTPHMPAVKIASGDLTYHDLIIAAAATGKPVLLSTGMATIDEVLEASNLIPQAQRAVLHCASIYPLPDEKANLAAISTMIDALPNSLIGYSDHTLGSEACVAAVALGARTIEKHFTLDTTQTPGDHVLSLDPEGLKNLMHQINRVNLMLGDGVKRPAPGEEFMQTQMRRGIYAARDLGKAEELTEKDVLVIRPETDVKPYEMNKIVGRCTAKPIGKLQPISVSDLD